jgi:hypothetical protein
MNSTEQQVVHNSYDSTCINRKRLIYKVCNLLAGASYALFIIGAVNDYSSLAITGIIGYAMLVVIYTWNFVGVIRKVNRTSIFLIIILIPVLLLPILSTLAIFLLDSNVRLNMADKSNILKGISGVLVLPSWWQWKPQRTILKTIGGVLALPMLVAFSGQVADMLGIYSSSHPWPIWFQATSLVLGVIGGMLWESDRIVKSVKPKSLSIWIGYGIFFVAGITCVGGIVATTFGVFGPVAEDKPIPGMTILLVLVIPLILLIVGSSMVASPNKGKQSSSNDLSEESSGKN